MTSVASPLQDKIILVTGGAQGIGGAGARICAQQGAHVIITDVKQETGSQLAAALQADGHRAQFLPLDVRDDAQVEAVFRHVAQEHGRLDALICAAGVLKGPMLLPDAYPVEMFDEVMAVNVRGMFLCIKAAQPLLEAAGRSVLLLIGSGAGVIGGSSSLAYGASKGAVNGLGMTLERHLAARGIRVNVVCPGGIETELKLEQMRDAASAQGLPFDPEEAASRLGDPDGVGELLAFLVSEQARYVRRNLFTR